MNIAELGRITREKRAYGQQGSPYMQQGIFNFDNRQQGSAFGGHDFQASINPAMSHSPQALGQQTNQMQPAQRTWGQWLGNSVSPKAWKQWWDHNHSPQGRDEYHRYQAPQTNRGALITNAFTAASMTGPVSFALGPAVEAAGWGLHGMPSKAHINDRNRAGSYANTFGIKPGMSGGEKFRRLSGAVSPSRMLSGSLNAFYEAQKGHKAHQANKPEAWRNTPWIHKDWF